MKRLIFLFFLASFLVGCQPVSQFVSPEPASVLHIYPSSIAPILNPERGFFLSYQLPGPSRFGSLRNMGYTLVHLNIHLDNWRETDVPQNVLSELDTNLANVRQAGIKTIIRFSYNQGSLAASEPDASKAQILRHIEQLTPLLQKNADVIAWIEAGFIGAWGEWHASANGLDNIQDKKEILFALLKALPDSRMVQVRYPSDIIEMFPTPAEAIKARVAHHNDCFLSSDTDVGTYEQNGVVTIERDQAYLAELTRFTPMSGETCAPNPPRSECMVALQEMALLHFSAINGDYHEEILRSWEHGGCMEEINRRLGYRLALTSSTFNEQVHPGGLVRLTVNLQNTGFASIINRRPLYAVLKGQQNSSYIAELNLDPRAWEPGKASFTAKLYIPSSASEGMYQLGLWLPDEYESLRKNPLYSIRFANENVSDETTSLNVLGTVMITQAVPGNYYYGGDFRAIVTSSSIENQK